VFLGRDFAAGERHSEDTSQRIDAEIRRIVTEQYDRATRILTEHKADLESVSGALLDYETLDGDDIDRLMRGEKLTRPVAPGRPKHAAAAAASDDDKRRPAVVPPLVGKKDPEPEPA